MVCFATRRAKLNPASRGRMWHSHCSITDELGHPQPSLQTCLIAAAAAAAHLDYYSSPPPPFF